MPVHPSVQVEKDGSFGTLRSEERPGARTPGTGFLVRQKAMSTNATSGQKSSEQSPTELRAQWEAFEFRVPVPGRVRVENTSYGEESGEHVYVVSVENNHATACTCPADKYRSGLCKHRHAVERQPAVMLAASASDDDRMTATSNQASTVAAVATDGGHVEDSKGETCSGRFL